MRTVTPEKTMDRYFLATLILTMCAVISPAYSQVQCYTGPQCPAGREVNHTMTGVQGRTESVAECCQVRRGGSLRLLEDPGGPCRECSKDVCTWCNIAPTLTFVRRGSDADLNLRCQGQLPDVPDVVSNGICADVTLKIEEAPNPLPTTAACNATITRTYTAKDACENMVHVVQMITIREMGLPVFTFVPPNITVECGTYIKNPDLTGGWAIARSACGDPVGVNFTDRIISDNLCNESIARTWTAVDDCGNQISVRQIIYLQITIPPTILLPEVEDIFTCDENLGPYLAVDRSATLDRDNSCAYVSYPRLTHSDTLTNGTANGGSRTVTRTWTVTDICGNSASRTQLITVHHKTGLDFGFPVGFPTDLFITLNDTCANIPQPPNITSIDVDFEEEMSSSFCPNIYNITRTWTGQDECGNFVTRTQGIFVDYDTPPFMSGVPETLTASCNSVPSFDEAPTAAGHCGLAVDVELYSVVRVNGSCPYDYTEIRTWRATDECGKQSVFVQNVTVVPAGAPNFTFVPPTITVSCDTDWTDPESTGGPALATSLCGHQVTIQTADEILNDNDCTLRVRRTWTAVDVCGQTATADQLIIVRSEPPAFNFVPAPISVPCGTDWNDFDNTGGDAESISPCGLDVTVESADRATNDDLCDTKIRRSWTVIDSCGHVARAEQIISIVVNQQLILRPFENHTAEVCPQYDGDLGPSKFDDKAVVENLSSCLLDAHLTINSTDLIVASNSSFGTRLIRRSWSVKDICGNGGFTDQYIFVKDIERPELVLEPNTTEVRCSNTSELLLLPDPVLRPLYPSPRTWYLVNRMSLRDVTQDHLYHHTCNGQTVVRTYQAYELTCDMNITLRQYVKVISAATTTTSTSTTTTSTTTEASTTSSTTTASTTSATPTTSPTTSTGTDGNAFTLATLGAVAAEDSIDSEATEVPECADCDSNVPASPLTPVMNLADFLAALGLDQSTAYDEGNNMAPTIAPPAGYPGQRNPDNTLRRGGLSHFFNSHSRLGNFKYDPAPASPGHGKAPGHGNSPGLIFVPEPIVVNNPVEHTNEAEATGHTANSSPGAFSSSYPMARPLNVIGLMPPKPEQHENVKPNKQPSRPHMPFFGFSSRLRSTGHSDDEFRNPKTPAS